MNANINYLSCPAGLYFDLDKKFCNKQEFVNCEISNLSDRISIQSSPIIQSSTESTQSSTPIAVHSSQILESTTVVSQTSLPISISSDIVSTSPIIAENTEKVTTIKPQTKSVLNETSEICPKGDGYCLFLKLFN